MKFYLDIPRTFPGNIVRTYDLIVPEGDPKSIPLLMWIHGGGWCGGEKRVFNDFERFVFRGCAVLSIDYRLSQEAPFPAALDDCRAAVHWAHDHASEYGYCADRIIIGGSSAGGHLAALLGLTADSANPAKIEAVVDLFGPTDLTCLPTLENEISAFTSGDPQLALQASPMHTIGSVLPDFLIAHGAKDDCVPISQSRKFHQALIQAGCNSEYLEIAGGGHGFDTPEFYDALTAFIEKHTLR